MWRANCQIESSRKFTPCGADSKLGRWQACPSKAYDGRNDLLFFQGLAFRNETGPNITCWVARSSAAIVKIGRGSSRGDSESKTFLCFREVMTYGAEIHRTSVLLA